MQLRHAGIGDLAAVTALEIRNFSQEEQISSEVITYYLGEEWKTCLLMETEQGEVVGFLLALATEEDRVTDRIFTETQAPIGLRSHLAIASLSISPDYKGQGLGTLLLAGLKEICQAEGYQGISLTCKDYLISYYEMNGFEDCGESDSQFGHQIWYDMYWKSPIE